MSYYSRLACEEWEQNNFYTEEDCSLSETHAEETEEPDSIPQPAEPACAPAPSPEDEETARRLAHEAAEVQRKAEWDAAQEKKRAEEQEQLDRIANMNEDALRLAAAQRISAATDKMTSRSMKESVSAHIQTLCERDVSFARLTMHPRKSMLHCIQYIFHHAKDYLQKELTDEGVKTSSVYGRRCSGRLVLPMGRRLFPGPGSQRGPGT